MASNISGQQTNENGGFWPNRKIGISAIAGALTVLAVWTLNNYVLQGPPIPGEIASAITTALTFIVGYWVPEPSSNA